MNRQIHNAYLQFITSMLIFGTIGIFRRFIPLSSGVLAFARGLLGNAFLSVFMRVSRRSAERIGGKTLLLLVLTGALIGFNWIFLFEAYKLYLRRHSHHVLLYAAHHRHTALAALSA